MTKEQNIGLPEELIALEPTVDSVPWMRRAGRTCEIEALMAQTDAKIAKLSDYYEVKNFNIFDVIQTTELAAKAASARLYDWVKFHMQYRYPPIDPWELAKGSRESRILFQSYLETVMNLNLNLAVSSRDEIRDANSFLKIYGNQEEIESAREEAQVYFNEYKRFQKALKESKEGNSPQIPCPAFLEEDFETADQRANVAELFFDEDVRDAYSFYLQCLIMSVAENLSIAGTNPGLIRVYYEAGIRNKPEFTFVEKENNHLFSVSAKRFGVPVDVLKRYADFTIREAYGQNDISDINLDLRA